MAGFNLLSGPPPEPDYNHHERMLREQPLYKIWYEQRQKQGEDAFFDKIPMSANPNEHAFTRQAWREGWIRAFQVFILQEAKVYAET